MLRECHSIAQIDREPPRRWFHDESFDLLVWYAGEAPVGFELIYATPDGQRGLTAKPSGALTHKRIDDDDSGPLRYNMARLHAADNRFPIEVVLPEFLERSKTISPDIVHIVTQKMQDLASRSERDP